MLSIKYNENFRMINDKTILPDLHKKLFKINKKICFQDFIKNF